MKVTVTLDLPSEGTLSVLRMLYVAAYYGRIQAIRSESHSLAHQDFLAYGLEALRQAIARQEREERSNG